MVLPLFVLLTLSADGGVPRFRVVPGTGERAIVDTQSSAPPSDAQVLKAEKASAAELARQFPTRPFGTYLRQHGGALVDGKRMVFIKAVCEPLDSTWRERGLPEARGGGACFLHADWEEGTGAITQFRANSAR